VTAIRTYALAPNTGGLGTPYEFVRVSSLNGRRWYCNADMALQAELGFPVAGSYSGPRTVDGCPR